MTLDFALKNAAEFHDGQLDKNGDPYILHPLRVMLHASLSTNQERIVAVLHDAVEDSGVSLNWVNSQFGEEVSAAIDAISQCKGEQRSEYYKRVKANPLALKVKLADIADNSDTARLARLDETTRLRLSAKYREALVALGCESASSPRTYDQGAEDMRERVLKAMDDADRSYREYYEAWHYALEAIRTLQTSEEGSGGEVCEWVFREYGSDGTKWFGTGCGCLERQTTGPFCQCCGKPIKITGEEG